MDGDSGWHDYDVPRGGVFPVFMLFAIVAILASGALETWAGVHVLPAGWLGVAVLGALAAAATLGVWWHDERARRAQRKIDRENDEWLDMLLNTDMAGNPLPPRKKWTEV